MQGVSVQSFSFEVTTRIVFGVDSVRQVADEVDRLGAGRALLVIDRAMAEEPAAALVQQVLGRRLAGVFSEVLPRTHDGIVERGAAMVRRTGADVLVSLGGGSTIDTAKCIALVLAEGSPLGSHRVVFNPPRDLQIKALNQPKLPHIAIPTTAGSASEVTRGASAYNEATGEKMTFLDPAVAPRTCLLDPLLTRTMSPALTATTGINALAHCVEAVYSVQAQPVSAALALQAMALIAAHLPRCVADGSDIEARAQQQIAATMSGMAFVNALVGLHHAACHVLSERFGVPHGVANSVMLPYVMRYNLDATAAAQGAMARALGLPVAGLSDVAAGELAIAHVAGLIGRLGTPTRLREVAVPQDGLAVLAAETVRHPLAAFNPRPVHDAGELLQLFQQAW